MFVFVFSITDDELHSRLLRDRKCKNINQGGECGTGISSYRVLGKLQSKVNNLMETGRKVKF